MSELLEFYASPGRFTTLTDGDAASGGIEEIVAIVQGHVVGAQGPKEASPS